MCAPTHAKDGCGECDAGEGCNSIAGSSARDEEAPTARTAADQGDAECDLAEDEREDSREEVMNSIMEAALAVADDNDRDDMMAIAEAIGGCAGDEDLDDIVAFEGSAQDMDES